MFKRTMSVAEKQSSSKDYGILEEVILVLRPFAKSL